MSSENVLQKLVDDITISEEQATQIGVAVLSDAAREYVSEELAKLSCAWAALRELAATDEFINWEHSDLFFKAGARINRHVGRLASACVNIKIDCDPYPLGHPETMDEAHAKEHLYS